MATTTTIKKPGGVTLSSYKIYSKIGVLENKASERLDSVKK